MAQTRRVVKLVPYSPIGGGLLSEFPHELGVCGATFVRSRSIPKDDSLHIHMQPIFFGSVLKLSARDLDISPFSGNEVT